MQKVAIPWDGIPVLLRSWLRWSSVSIFWIRVTINQGEEGLIKANTLREGPELHLQGGTIG